VSRRLDDNWPESTADQGVAYLPNVPTDFDSELRRILFDFAMKSVKSGTFMSDTGTDGLIKQAVDKYVIGERLKPIDVGALTGPSVRRKNSKDIYASSQSLTQAQGAYLMAHNGLLARQRQSLWGTK